MVSHRAAIVLAALLLKSSAGVPTNQTVVSVPGVGEVACNVIGNGMIEALGIPFATAPTGENRFRPPQPIHSYPPSLDATSYGPACPQTYTPDPSKPWPISEDCLSLNIWSPASENREGFSKLPVFFWIHGGGFLQGSGKLYNGSALANLGLVAVSINYRLGALGWFASEEITKENPDAPGNGAVHGFLDQVAALKWVRQHIGAFGGDLEQITIAGESAGSLSVCAHLHLPVSKGLFKRAIMESGSCVANSPWGAWNSTAMKDTSRALKLSLLAPNLKALRRVSVARMLKDPLFEAVSPSADGFYLPQNPAGLPVVAKGIDIIVGANTMDTLNAPPYIGTIPVLPDFTPKDAKSLRKRLTDYFGSKIFDIYPAPADSASQQEVAAEFYGIGGDVCNQCPKHFAAQKFLQADSQVFSYEFGFTVYPFPGFACHACEIPDVFNGSLHGSGEIVHVYNMSYNAQLGDTMSRYWANFVKTGKPGWPNYSGSIAEAKSLQITTGADGQPKVNVTQGLDFKKCSFFEQFIKASKKNWQNFELFCLAPAEKLSASADTAIVV